MSGDCLSYIAALDVGTTTIRCAILNSLNNVVGSAYTSVKLHYPQPGYVEIKPDELWESVVTVIKDSVSDAKLDISSIASLGISTQRATFTTWRKSNSEYFHNFITWKDIRTKVFSKKINSSWTIQVVRGISSVLHFFTRSKKFLLGSKLKFTSNYVSMRLLWVLNNIPELQKALSENDVMFGTLDTWLLYKLTGGRTYVTEITNASATGIFDPFELGWSLIARLLEIPLQIMPEIVANDYDFGSTEKTVFGHSMKIGCVISDQSASLFGSRCLYDNDLKVTLGTGGFLNVNTLNNIHASTYGMYPLVGWKLQNKIIYITEVPCNDAGSLMEWALRAGLINNASETSGLARSVENNGGVYFISAFSGLGTPINNETAASGFLGIKPTTTKAHMVRAILESIVFRITLGFNVLKEERNRNYRNINIDGGVARNDFICQLLADLTGLPVKRHVNIEMGIYGVGFLTGLCTGVWKTIDDIKFEPDVDIFQPNENGSYIEKCRNELDNWFKAATRFTSWYSDQI